MSDYFSGRGLFGFFCLQPIFLAAMLENSYPFLLIHRFRSYSLHIMGSFFKDGEWRNHAIHLQYLEFSI